MRLCCSDLAMKLCTKPTGKRFVQRISTGNVVLFFSLLRCDSREESENKFVCFKEIVPIFIKVAKDVSFRSVEADASYVVDLQMCNINGLQKLCDTLTQHPSWTLAHVAAHFGHYDSLNSPLLSSYLNSSDPVTGMSPLQVALETNNLRTVQTLLNANCSLEHIDNNGNSVFHLAANTNKDIILVSYFCYNVLALSRFFIYLE